MLISVKSGIDHLTEKLAALIPKAEATPVRMKRGPSGRGLAVALPQGAGEPDETIVDVMYKCEKALVEVVSRIKAAGTGAGGGGAGGIPGGRRESPGVAASEDDREGASLGPSDGARSPTRRAASPSAGGARPLARGGGAPLPHPAPPPTPCTP